MADVVSGRPDQKAAEPSTSELVQRATEQVSRLVRDELALAKAELAEKGKHAGIGFGLFGGGGVLGLYGLTTLVAAVVLLLAEVLAAWLAALIVAVALFMVAGILALLGRRQVRKAVPPMPESAAESVRADVRTVTAAVRREREARQ
jgi:uncharacterized membrane protein YqjE